MSNKLPPADCILKVPTAAAARFELAKPALTDPLKIALPTVPKAARLRVSRSKRVALPETTAKVQPPKPGRWYLEQAFASMERQGVTPDSVHLILTAALAEFAPHLNQQDRQKISANIAELADLRDGRKSRRIKPMPRNDGVTQSRMTARMWGVIESVLLAALVHKRQATTSFPTAIEAAALAVERQAQLRLSDVLPGPGNRSGEYEKKHNAAAPAVSASEARIATLVHRLDDYRQELMAGHGPDSVVHPFRAQAKYIEDVPAVALSALWKTYVSGACNKLPWVNDADDDNALE